MTNWDSILLKRKLSLSLLDKEADQLADAFEGCRINDEQFDLFINSCLENDAPGVAARRIGAICLLFLEQPE